MITHELELESTQHSYINLTLFCSHYEENLLQKCSKKSWFSKKSGCSLMGVNSTIIGYSIASSSQLFFLPEFCWNSWIITPYQRSENGPSFQMRFLLRVHCVTRVQRTHHMMFVRSLVRRFHSSFHDQVSQWVSVSQKWTHCVFTENCAYQEFRNMYLVNV